MKLSIVILFLLTLMFSGQSVLAKTFNTPTMPVELAIENAKKYALEKKIDVSRAFIVVVEYHNLYNEYEGPYWRVRWEPRIPAKGGWFELRIYPDGSVAEIPGK